MGYNEEVADFWGKIKFMAQIFLLIDDAVIVGKSD